MGIQEYLTNKNFTRKEINLMHRLRSRCHPAKMNFRKMYKNDLLCSLKCDSLETQTHIFEDCKPIFDKLKLTQTCKLNQVFGTVTEQKEAASIFIKIEEARIKLLKDIL